MSIHAYTSRFFTLRHVARSVLLAVRWGLIAFAVMAALRVAWRLTASARTVRTVESVMSVNKEAK